MNHAVVCQKWTNSLHEGIVLESLIMGRSLENLAKYLSNISRIISASRGKNKESFKPQLGSYPPVAILPTLAAPELQLSESPHILKRYDTPPAEHGSAREVDGGRGWHLNLAGILHCNSVRGVNYTFFVISFTWFFPLNLAKMMSIWDSNTQRAQKGKTWSHNNRVTEILNQHILSTINSSLKAFYQNAALDSSTTSPNKNYPGKRPQTVFKRMFIKIIKNSNQKTMCRRNECRETTDHIVDMYVCVYVCVAKWRICICVDLLTSRSHEL